MENIDSLDYHEDLQEQQIGAKVLSSANFQENNKEIVDSSFNKAIKRGEKLPGKNAERRNMAYLERLQGMIDKYGDKFEKKVWGRTVDSLIIKPTEITDDYWKTQEQILRDNGQGRKLSSREKELLVEDIQKHQRESLESWTNYLSHEDCPYPTWFKVYTMNGISKMGVFDKSKNIFKKRDNTSVAPYPHLNQATLAKVYDTITDFYNVDVDKDLAGAKDVPDDETESARNAELDALVKSGNFNKLYSKLLLSEKMIMKTPERTEDIHGEWVEYGLGDEDAIASAADGTPWCVASPSVGRSYLTTGKYGNSYNNEYGESKAKFIFFHLHDEDGRLADNACASIRLDTDGNVAEISGLKDGQALEDSLVPIVEEKVRSLPGGEKFLKAFADKHTLIALDRKMQKGEDLTKEELEFLYEINRPIETLDTYNDADPRIPEIKEKYDIEYALDAGIDTNNLVSNLSPDDIARNLDTLIQHGADTNNLVFELDYSDIAENLDTLIQHGANIDINNLVYHLDYDDIAHYLNTLIQHGANIDINNLVSNLDSHDIVYELDTLIQHGANIDINNLVSNLDPDFITFYLDTLIQHGANIDINNLVSNLDPFDIFQYLDTLIQHGANINQIAEKLKSGGYDITEYLAKYGYTE
ncbi:hypothetical protein IKD57_04040 [Candidatus Saccharibacteria bacterium]|nr:hypothetical protein [Candidatus Saccharibacteria bacterium]